MKTLIKLKKYIEGQYGQAALIMVLVIMVVILVLITSIGLLTYNDLRNLDTQLSSTQSYYAAEAGIEDGVYRILRNPAKATPGNYSLTIGSSSVQWTIAASPSVVTSTGTTDNKARKLRAELGGGGGGSTITTPFNYAVQVGYGGGEVGGTIVNGSLYSNGPVWGGTGHLVTGDATAASLPWNQVNQDPGVPPAVPPNSINFRNAAASQDLAQSFSVTQTEPINAVQFYIRKSSSLVLISPTVRITTDNSGSPSATVLATGTLDVDLVDTSFGWVTVNINTNPSDANPTPLKLNPGVTYWVVVDNNSHSSSYYFTVGANNNGYGSTGQAKIGRYGTSWTDTSPANLDAYFKVGTVGIIHDMDVNGTVRANKVTDTDVAGNLYCQSGLGNNNNCINDPLQYDQPPVNFPISDAQIADLKAQAEAGGTITGNYIQTGGDHSLGPTKITGNMSITSGTNLTLTGTVYVQGTVTFGNSSVKLHSSYGPNSGVLIADGYIDASTGNNWQGSGDAQSFLILISTNDCTGHGPIIGGISPTGLPCAEDFSAINIGTGTGTPVLLAPRGEVHNGTGTTLIAVAAYSVKLNAQVNYNTALGSITIPSSGGGGGSPVFSGWKEVE